MSAFHSRNHGRDGAWHDRSRGPARTLCQAIVAMRCRYERERRIAAEAKYLKSFDEHMLSDIGLTRAEIDDFVRRRATQGMPQSNDDKGGSLEGPRPFPSVYDRP